MGPFRTRCVATLLLLSSAACGDVTGTASDTGSDTGSGTTTDVEPEPITARGIAAVVRDALGAERISAYSRSDEVVLAGAEVQVAGGPDVLVVMVQTEGEPPTVADCDDLAGTGSGDDSCTVTEDGTVLVSGAGEALSDGTSRGSTVRAMSVNPETGRV